MALLPVHSQNFASLRKNSFKTACRRTVVRSEPVRYRGQVLTPRLLRRTGNCPPPSRKELMAQPNNSSARGTASRRAGHYSHVMECGPPRPTAVGRAQNLEQQTPISTAMSSSFRRRTGRSPLNSGFPDGTASPRPRLQNTASSLRLLTLGASLVGTIRTDHQPLEQMES